MENSDCEKAWVIKGDLGTCPIHKQKFWMSKKARCKYYTPTPQIFSDGTGQNKSKHIIQHAKKQACGSVNMPSNPTSIDNSTPKWVDDVNETTGDIRSHAFTFKVTVDNPKNWSIRQKILESEGFKVLPKGGVARTDMIFFHGFKIWLSKNKITVYFPDYKHYWVDSARTGENYAINDLITLLHELELTLSSDFRINKEYRFKVSRQHHALVQNDLAKMYNRKHQKLEVFNNRGELWLIIDNSDVHNIRMNDLETVHKKDAPKDMDGVVKPFFEQLHKTKLMPEDILNMLKEIALNQARQSEEYNKRFTEQNNMINDVTLNQKVFAENQVSHVASVQKLGVGSEAIAQAITKLDKRIETLGKLTSKKESNDMSIKEYKVHKSRKILREFGW